MDIPTWVFLYSHKGYIGIPTWVLLYSHGGKAALKTMGYSYVGIPMGFPSHGGEVGLEVTGYPYSRGIPTGIPTWVFLYSHGG